MASEGNQKLDQSIHCIDKNTKDLINSLKKDALLSNNSCLKI